MGCWNGTCALTGLPIVVDDEIVLIPLISTTNIFGNYLTYRPEDKYSPLGLPIKGLYDDYGGIEKIQMHEENERFLRNQEFYKIAEDKSISKQMVEDAYERSRFSLLSDIVIHTYDSCETEKIEIEDMEQFLKEYIYNDGYMVKVDHFNANRLFGNYFMIHREIYEILVKEISNRIPYGQEKTFRELYKERIITVLEKEKEIYNIKDEEERDYKLFSFRLNGSISKILGLSEPTHAKNTYEYFFKVLSNEVNEELMEELLDLIMFTKALDGLRKGFHCISGAGSQQNELYLHKLVADFVNKYIDGKIKERRDDSYEYDEMSDKEITSETMYWWNLDLDLD